MCGRFTQQRPTSELAEIFGAEDLADDPGGRYNVAPTDPAAVVVERGDRRAVVTWRWGLVPHWASDARIGSRTFNARAETVARLPAFRDAFRRRRCIVPVDGFYEWRREADGGRQPFLVRRRDGGPLALAGLWAGWRDPEADGADLEGEGRPPILRTFTIVTTTPNALLATLHDRMPVILAPSSWDLWLDPEPPDQGELQALLVPAADDGLDMYAVPRLVNDVRRDGPELVEPLPAIP